MEKFASRQRVSSAEDEPVSGSDSRATTTAVATPSSASSSSSSSSMKLNTDGRGQQPLNKRSMDYVLRSGLAGGLAGCAVSYWDSVFFFFFFFFFWLSFMDWMVSM